MITKGEVLAYVSEFEPVTSTGLTMALGYPTRARAAVTLLRLCRQGQSRREPSAPGTCTSSATKGARGCFVLAESPGGICREGISGGYPFCLGET